MAHVLISFLGHVPKTEGGYRSTRYRFPDGQEDPECAFLGWNLMRRLQPDKMVILGTSGSMWDHLFERDFVLGEIAETERLDLMHSVEQKQVTQEQLDELAPVLSEENRPCVIQLKIIPYGQNMQEQCEILHRMAVEVSKRDRVSLDITHGFRHLPMLGLLSALHLRSARQADIHSIHYGIYDPDTREAPVYDLKGLLHIADWVEALHAYDKDGDYGVFADLLEEDGLNKVQTNHLRRAAFRERISNAWQARKDLSNFGRILDQGLPGVGALFTDELRTRIQWYKGPDLLFWQRELAYEYLERDDYIRAAIYAIEGFITRLIDSSQGEQMWDYVDREGAREKYLHGTREPQRLREDFLLLNALRNRLAHGTRSNDNRIGRKVESIVEDAKTLKEEMSRLIRALLQYD